MFLDLKFLWDVFWTRYLIKFVNEMIPFYLNKKKTKKNLNNKHHAVNDSIDKLKMICKFHLHDVHVLYSYYQ